MNTDDENQALEIEVVFGKGTILYACEFNYIVLDNEIFKTFSLRLNNLTQCSSQTK